MSIVTALVCLTGCTTVVTGAPSADPAPAPTEGPGSDPVAWVDRLCGATLTSTTPLVTLPDFAASADLAALKTAYSTYLGTVVTGAQQAKTQLGAVGLAPVAEGDAVRDKALADTTKLESDFTAVKATVDGADPADPQAFVTALGTVETTLKTIVAPDVLTGLVAVPRLKAAAERSAQCQKLSTVAVAAPR